MFFRRLCLSLPPFVKNIFLHFSGRGGINFFKPLLMILSFFLLTFLIDTRFALADFTPRWDELKSLPKAGKQRLMIAQKKGLWKDFADTAVSGKIKNLKDGTTEFLLGFALYKTNMNVLSYAVLADMIDTYPTSLLVDQSLELITEIFQTNLIETDFLKEVFDKRLVETSTPEGRAFLKYHKFLSFRTKGFYRWSNNELRTLPGKTFWRSYFQYIKLVKKSEKLKARHLLKAWTRFSKKTKLPEMIKNWSEINRARILYELGLYSEADNIYKEVRLNRFDQGTILRERAWVYYHLNRFKESLGMLNQMRTSLYGFYHHTDEHLLAGLIYRENCQQGLLEDLQKKVNYRVEKIKKSISQLKPYNKFQDVFQFSIYHPSIYKTARMMTYLNNEMELLVKSSLKGHRGQIQPSQQKLNQYSMTVINRQLPSAVRESIEDMLILKEQVDYLTYSLRLRRIKKVDFNYDSITDQVRSNLSKTAVVWPVYSEVWNDEVINFQSVLENQCL